MRAEGRFRAEGGCFLTRRRRVRRGRTRRRTECVSGLGGGGSQTRPYGLSGRAPIEFHRLKPVPHPPGDVSEALTWGINRWKMRPTNAWSDARTQVEAAFN